MKTAILAITFLSSVNFSIGQILSGPMLGYTTQKEALVWVQLSDEYSIVMEYFPSDDSSQLNQSEVRSYGDHGNTAHLVATNLEPGTSYSYRLYLKNKKEIILSRGSFSTQSLWQHRKDPPEFSFAIGSCTYINDPKYDRPGQPFGGGYEIFESIIEKNPDMMLWLGDNIYLREVDWTSKSGIYYRYTSYKSLAELQPLWKSMPHYAIWDDHDYGPNDGDRSFVNKELSLQAFKDFWGNMSYGVNGKGGITGQFSFNDLDFFLLDNRFFRTPNNRKTGERHILGDEQIDWLIDALVNSKASFKIIAVGGQFLSPAKVYENHANYEEERKKIIELIEQEGINNVIFLSGDRHKTELSEMELKNGFKLYDFTSSPLTAKAYDSKNEGNTLQVEGTHVSTQNFGTLNVSGKWGSRKISIKTFDKTGNLIWEKLIDQQQ